MPTRIYFIGGGSLSVGEKPEKVQEAFNPAEGLPVRLTADASSGGGEVHVNPAAIAYWQKKEDGKIEAGPIVWG